MSKIVTLNTLNNLEKQLSKRKFPKIDLSLKQVKSQRELLEEESNRAEKYLQKLGNELLQFRNLYSDFDSLNISSISSVSDFSPKQKKPIVSKKKVNKRQKKIVSDIRQLTLNLMQLEAEMDRKENIKRTLFEKSEELLLVTEASQDKIKQSNKSPEKSLKLDDKFDEINDYFNQFNNYKIKSKIEINEIDQISNSSSNESFRSTNTKVVKRNKKLRKRNPTKINKKSFKNSNKNLLINESNNESTISDDDYSKFFSAYDNHRKVESLRQSLDISTSSSYQIKTESSNSCKNIKLFNFLALQSRNASMITSLKDKSFSTKSQTDSFNYSSNEFNIIPLPTQNMLNVINGLREIENKIEKEE